VELVDIAFTQTELTVPANSEITVNLTNSGTAPHTFTIDALGVDSGQIPPGGTGTVTFNSGAPGTQEYYCSVPGHKQAGMVGTLIVQ
jgi:nitrite reductase (NO-forming)